MIDNDHEKWNEAMARKYDPNLFITQSGWCVRWVEGRRLRESARLLAGAQNTLDVGCGAGNLLPYLSGRITGIDLSDSLLEQARTLVSGRADIKILKGNAEALPFEDNTFDALLCSEVLEHVEHPDKVLDEIHRVARPGAMFLLTVPNERLINFTKRIVLALGVKGWVAGRYPMSDNMLEEWHRSEIEAGWVANRTASRFELKKKAGVPFRFFAYHSMYLFRVVK